MEMGFGKYSAREVRWVVENDDSYVGSMFSHAWGTEAVRSEARQILNEDRYCPSCGRVLTRVVFGLPTPGFYENQTYPVVLAGCIVPRDAAAWKCESCERGFQRDLSEGNLSGLVPPRPRDSWPSRVFGAVRVGAKGSLPHPRR